jgi:hypothetical protein
VALPSAKAIEETTVRTMPPNRATGSDRIKQQRNKLMSAAHKKYFSLPPQDAHGRMQRSSKTHKAGKLSWSLSGSTPQS